MSYSDTKPVDTTGSISSANSLIWGILGLAGAPTFQRGENVITIIKRDHQKVSTLYEQYKSTQEISKRQEYAWTLTKELVQHSEVEQLIIYPLLKMRGGSKTGGDHRHDRSLTEHQQIRELLYDLDHTKVDYPSHPMKLDRVAQAVLSHVQEEETEILPEIERNFSIEELERLGNAFEKHKFTAVTRPHPHAPLQGPMAAVASMVTKPIDLVRDVARNATEKKPE